MIFEKVTPGMVVELTKLRMNLNHFYLLELFNYDKATEADDPTSRQLLERKALIVEGQITDSGRILYKQLLEQKIQPDPFQKIELKSIKNIAVDEFEKWWQIFPTTTRWEDTTVYPVKLYNGTRNMKPSKAKAKEEFTKLVVAGEYTAENIIKGTINCLEEAKAESRKTRENKLNYIPAADRFLRTRHFAGFVDIGEKILVISKGTIDL